MEMIAQLRWQDGVDIGIITFLIYRLLQILRRSRELVESVFQPHSLIHDGAARDPKREGHGSPLSSAAQHQSQFKKHLGSPP
jgi:hypothetical protein